MRRAKALQAEAKREHRAKVITPRASSGRPRSSPAAGAARNGDGAAERSAVASRETSPATPPAMVSRTEFIDRLALTRRGHPVVPRLDVTPDAGTPTLVRRRHVRRLRRR